MIKITCPSCRRVHKKTDESLLGKLVKCKDCGFTFKVLNESQPVQQPNAGEVKQITTIKGRPIEQQWYWMQNGQKNGPVVGIVGLKELAGSGRLKPTDMIWRDGLPNWVRASQVKGLCPDQTSTANGQAAGEPVPAPVATEVPHPPSLAAEARSATTWKCPTCAEEIQKEANKCRFCGMILTKAAKMGYPAFYENVAKDGISFTSLLFDYGDFLYPDEEGVNDCCLGAPDMLGSLFDNRDNDKKTKVLKIAGGIIKAMRERLSDIPAKSQEALTIKAG